MFASKLREIGHYFCKNTMIHGLGHAMNSHSLLEFALWMTLFLACVGMTVHDFVILYVYYASEPTTTLVTVAHNESSAITIQNATICIDVELNHRPIPPGVNLTRVEKELLPLLPLINSTTYDNDSCNAIVLTGDTLTLVHQLLVAITDVEYNLFSNPFSNQSWAIEYNPSAASGDWNLASIPYQEAEQLLSGLYEFLYENKVDLLQLWKSVISCVFKEMNFKVEFLPYAKSYLITQGETPSMIESHSRRSITYASNDLVCALLNYTSGVTFQTSLNLIRISFDPTEFYAANPLNSIASAGYYIYFDARGRAKRQNSRDSFAVASFGEHVETFVSLEGIFQAYNSPLRPCSNSANMTAFDCQMMCRVQSIFAQCSCWSFLYSYLAARYNPQNISICVQGQPPINGSANMPQLSQCASIENQAIAKESACEQRCMPDCEIPKYTFIPSLVGGGGDECAGADLNMTCFSIMVSTFFYPTFVESLVMDSSAFLANFGGIIGLWLGGSLIAFIHIPIYVVKATWLTAKNKSLHRKNVQVT